MNITRSSPPFHFSRIDSRIHRDIHGGTANGSLSENIPLVGSSKSRSCSTGKWRALASDDSLWSDLFKERWGIDGASFYAPIDSKSWKDVYIVQDRCDRVGLGLKIIREGDEYFLVHQGEIQRHLGSRHSVDYQSSNRGGSESMDLEEPHPTPSILDKILFFIGDMETASMHAKRTRFL